MVSRVAWAHGTQEVWAGACETRFQDKARRGGVTAARSGVGPPTLMTDGMGMTFSTSIYSNNNGSFVVR